MAHTTNELLDELNGIAIGFNGSDFGLPIGEYVFGDNLIAAVDRFRDNILKNNNPPTTEIVIDCFEVVDNSWNVDRHIAYVATKEIGKKLNLEYARVMPFNKTFKIYQSVEDFNDDINKEKVKAAKAKLTTEELKLLGLN